VESAEKEIASLTEELSGKVSEIGRLEGAVVKAGEDLEAVSKASGDEREAMMASQLKEASEKMAALEKQVAEGSEVVRSAQEEAAQAEQKAARVESAEKEIASLKAALEAAGQQALAETVAPAKPEEEAAGQGPEPDARVAMYRSKQQKAALRSLAKTWGQKTHRHMHGLLLCWYSQVRQVALLDVQDRNKRLLGNISEHDTEKKELRAQIANLRKGIDTKKEAESKKSSSSQLFTGMSVLDVSTKLRMNPLAYRKAGAVISNMQGAGYSDEQCNTICRALFLDNDDDDMQAAWVVFAQGRVYLDVPDFKKILPLMGEDVPEDEIDALFEMADEDGSGKIEYNEFVMLVKAMNADREDEDEDPEEKSSMFGGFGF